MTKFSGIIFLILIVLSCNFSELENQSDQLDSTSIDIKYIKSKSSRGITDFRLDNVEFLGDLVSHNLINSKLAKFNVNQQLDWHLSSNDYERFNFYQWEESSDYFMFTLVQFDEVCCVSLYACVTDKEGRILSVSHLGLAGADGDWSQVDYGRRLDFGKFEVNKVSYTDGYRDVAVIENKVIRDCEFTRLLMQLEEGVFRIDTVMRYVVKEKDTHNDFKPLEESVSDTTKMNLITDAWDSFAYLWEDDTINEKYLDNFSFLDLDKDGDLDLIFEGWSGGEPNAVRIFMNTDRDFVKQFDEHHAIIGVDKIGSDHYRLQMEDPGCCGEYIVNQTWFDLTIAKDSIDIKTKKVVRHINLTTWPEVILEEPFKVKVKHKDTHLRAKSTTETGEYWFGPEERQENVVATYDKGSKGYVVSQLITSEGKIWWFVEMSANNTIKSVFYDFDNPVSLAGWMEADDLEKTDS